MATKTMSANEAYIEGIVDRETFAFESGQTIVVTDDNRHQLSMLVASDQTASRVTVVVEDGRKFELVCDKVNESGQWLLRDDRSAGFTYYAMRRGAVVRDGYRIDAEYVSGMGISACFRKMFLLDQYGRRSCVPLRIASATVSHLQASK